MPFFWRGRGHDTNRRRRVVPGSVLERLEGRIVMSTSTAKVYTTTALQVGTTTAEKGQYVPLTATVENAQTGAPVSKGVVRFVLQGPGHETLGTTRLNKKGVTTLLKGNLTRLGVSQITALYLPSSSHDASSESSPQTVTVVPAQVTSFGITSNLYRSHPGKPITFTVTALGPNHTPVTNYTGVVQISTPTDNQTVYPPQFYASLGISAPAPITTQLATIPKSLYTFTTADHGEHTFVGGITFNKGGAQVLMVTQTNNMFVYGKATYGIA